MSKTTSRSIAFGLLFLAMALRGTGDARIPMILSAISASMFFYALF